MKFSEYKCQKSKLMFNDTHTKYTYCAENNLFFNNGEKMRTF